MCFERHSYQVVAIDVAGRSVSVFDTQLVFRALGYFCGPPRCAPALSYFLLCRPVGASVIGVSPVLGGRSGALVHVGLPAVAVGVGLVVLGGSVWPAGAPIAVTCSRFVFFGAPPLD